MKHKFLFLAAFFFSTIVANACNFKFTTDNNAKNCHSGDVITINVTLTLTHRSCQVAAAQTKFKTDGFQVVSASNWEQENPTTFTRKVKVKVLDDKKNKITLTAVRTCDKEGGLGVFTLPKI